MKRSTLWAACRCGVVLASAWASGACGDDKPSPCETARSGDPCGTNTGSGGAAGSTSMDASGSGGSGGAGGGDASVGPDCGMTRCQAGKVCCNPIMGICTEPGGVCVQ
jgi:hypothetical protein